MRCFLYPNTFEIPLLNKWDTTYTAPGQHLSHFGYDAPPLYTALPCTIIRALGSRAKRCISHAHIRVLELRKGRCLAPLHQLPRIPSSHAIPPIHNVNAHLAGFSRYLKILRVSIVPAMATLIHLHYPPPSLLCTSSGRFVMATTQCGNSTMKMPFWPCLAIMVLLATQHLVFPLAVCSQPPLHKGYAVGPPAVSAAGSPPLQRPRQRPVDDGAAGDVFCSHSRGHHPGLVKLA